MDTDEAGLSAIIDSHPRVAVTVQKQRRRLALWALISVIGQEPVMDGQDERLGEPKRFLHFASSFSVLR